MADMHALLGDRYEAAIKAASHAMSRHWRAMHTNEALGLQRMLAAHALDAALPELLADVWDEGHADGLHDAHEYREHRKMRNPYRPETITRDATGAPVTPAAPDAINPPPNPSAAATEPHNTEGDHDAPTLAAQNNQLLRR